MLSDRKAILLQSIVEAHIKTAEPIGSSFLVKHSELDVSAATIRNEARDLETEGYVAQPHTSAGRIPTAKGYRYYVDHIMQPARISEQIKRDIEQMVATRNDVRGQVKAVAKFSAEYLDSAVMVAFGPDVLYYTGISHLFAQPEFEDPEYTVHISKMFDTYEDHVPEMYERIGQSSARVLIGEENPIASSCAIIGARLGDTLFSVLAPLRTDYQKTVSLLQYINNTNAYDA